MANWQDRAELDGDVVFFSYRGLELEKRVSTVFIWDLDKTYLDTKIDSFNGLLQAILERTGKKRNVAGTDTLLRGLAWTINQKKEEETFPLYFITASPPQMEDRIYSKLKYDEILPLGAFFKDNLKNLKPGRFWRLTKQVGYKVQALLQLRRHLAEDVRQICWGDDSESDAIIYNLYSDICARRRSVSEIRAILEALFVHKEQVDRILELQGEIPAMDPVERIYINLATDTDPDYYFKFGRRTLATSNTFEVSLDLYQTSHLALDAVFAVTEDMISNYEFSPEELVRSFENLARRGVLSDGAREELQKFFIEKGLLPNNYQLPFSAQDMTSLASEQAWILDSIDYLHDDR